MTIQETLDYIHSVKWQGSKPGLSRTRELLAALGNPEKNLKFVHVAGTNGKGSTCAMIAAVLQNAGYKTGLYTSPYIYEFNERIAINSTPISDSALAAMTNEIRPVADNMPDPPTEFELITALAMMYFEKQGCDIIVLETGMGGELDSTNVISAPELAVITAIDYDHMQYLGPELTDIARAKAGIIKDGCDVLIYGGTNEVLSVFDETAKRRGARLIKADFSRIKKAGITPGGTMLKIEPYNEIHLALAGSYQPYNALVAVTALELLAGKGYNISKGNIENGISAARWPGRFEILGHSPEFILDGAHNPHGIKAAAESLQTLYGNRKFIFIFGVLADKDAQKMVQLISNTAACVFTVAPGNPRALDAKTLASMFSERGIQAHGCATVADGVAGALEAAGSNGVICALGSLFMSADIKTAYEKCEK